MVTQKEQLFPQRLRSPVTCHEPRREPSDSPHLSREVAEAALYCAHRTSTFRACAFREQEDDQATLPPRLFEQPLHPCLNLIQPLAQVGLKHISFGLHDHALGLDLILKQHQLGKQLLLL